MSGWVVVCERVHYRKGGDRRQNERRVLERRAAGPYTQEQAEAMCASLNTHTSTDWMAWTVPLGSVPAPVRRPAVAAHPLDSQGAR